MIRKHAGQTSYLGQSGDREDQHKLPHLTTSGLRKDKDPAPDTAPRAGSWIHRVCAGTVLFPTAISHLIAPSQSYVGCCRLRLEGRGLDDPIPPCLLDTREAEPPSRLHSGSDIQMVLD